MPGLITHYIAGQAVLKALSSEIQQIVNPHTQLYSLGTQGPDIFFYYMPGLIRKRSRGIGPIMHQRDLGLFFMEMAEAIRRHGNVQTAHMLYTYTAGFLVHYALDAHTHPFVYAQTTNERSRIKTSTNHRKLETIIDVMMLKLASGKRPSAYQLHELITPPSADMRIAAHATGAAISSVYGTNILTDDVYNAMRHMIKLTRFLQSSTGRRQEWMELLEDLTIRTRYVSCMIHMQDTPSTRDYLNMQNASWQAPWDESSRSESFLTLYENGIEDATNMIQALFSYIEGSLSRGDLIEIIGNRSLKTGQQICIAS